jgi:hypothetical protein
MRPDLEDDHPDRHQHRRAAQRGPRTAPDAGRAGEDAEREREGTARVSL